MGVVACYYRYMNTTTMIAGMALLALFPVAIALLPAVKAFFAHVPTVSYTDADFEASFDRWAEYRASEEYYNSTHEGTR